MARKKEKEQDIINISPVRRPYGVKLTLVLEPSTSFNIQGECTLLTAKNYIIRLIPKISQSNSPQFADLPCWDILVEGFSTAGEAEAIGLKVALGFLWAAVSRPFAARLLYSTPLPCSVYDRTKSKGLTMTGHAIIHIGLGVSGIVEPLNSIISSEASVDLKLLIAMELFASSRLETTARSRFVNMVSSLEPLAEQKRYENNELNQVIDEFKQKITSSSVPKDLVSGVVNRVDFLKMESISAAIRRIVRDLLPDEPDSLEIIEEAYNIRSRILHDGTSDSDLELKGREVEAVIRRIFDRIVQKELGR